MSHTIQELLLKVHQVNLRYDKQILRDVNFEIHNIVRPDMNQGQVVSLVGRSGVGKTQLFKILAGLIKPSTGKVTIDIDQHEVKPGEVGIIPQNYILFNHRTVYHNLKIGLDFSGKKISEKEEQDIINEYADKFHLREHLKKYPMMLSGGQRQRVSIIQQVLTGNKFILLDEPFSGLDMLMIDRVVDLLLNVSTINDFNTLIIVSHDIENALAISDTAFILANQEGQEGATITEKIDLVSLGFAWNPGIKQNAQFQELVAGMKHRI
ncbi:MAG: ATP-binding cassette domain-containing protein [Cytophagaceae bacterium]|jgi:ABC-type nitrate/sulfonate/bicarbonate transport system ATPase subunit|nr:ATP-binding cassette domain-containing protein [Cytophagaceae bacterium]